MNIKNINIFVAKFKVIWFRKTKNTLAKQNYMRIRELKRLAKEIKWIQDRIYGMNNLFVKKDTNKGLATIADINILIDFTKKTTQHLEIV